MVVKYDTNLTEQAARFFCHSSLLLVIGGGFEDCGLWQNETG